MICIWTPCFWFKSMHQDSLPAMVLNLISPESPAQRNPIFGVLRQSASQRKKPHSIRRYQSTKVEPHMKMSNLYSLRWCLQSYQMAPLRLRKTSTVEARLSNSSSKISLLDIPWRETRKLRLFVTRSWSHRSQLMAMKERERSQWWPTSSGLRTLKYFLSISSELLVVIEVRWFGINDMMSD